MSEIQTLAKKLHVFLPENACTPCAQYIVDHNIKLTIKKKRKTKLGDYRAPDHRIRYHRISVNGDLNPYMFLLVLLHEFAHMLVWKANKRRVKAHGEEWKDAYRGLYLEFADCFPDHVNTIIQTHFKNLKATTCNDPYLTKHLMYMDKKESILMLNELRPGDEFETLGRSFQMITKRRTRFLCLDLNNKKNYLVAGTAIVTRLNE